jgi:hypothetical protein
MGFWAHDLIPLLIPISFLITPHLRLERRKRKLRLFAVGVFIILLLSMFSYNDLAALKRILLKADSDNNYKTLSEQINDYKCLNITSQDYYFSFYDFFLHPMFVKDAGYYFMILEYTGGLGDYWNQTDESIKKATLIYMKPKDYWNSYVPKNVRDTVYRYNSYVAENFEPVCKGIYLRRKPGH